MGRVHTPETGDSGRSPADTNLGPGKSASYQEAFGCWQLPHREGTGGGYANIGLGSRVGVRLAVAIGMGKRRTVLVASFSRSPLYLSGSWCLPELY